MPGGWRALGPARSGPAARLLHLRCEEGPAGRLHRGAYRGGRLDGRANGADCALRADARRRRRPLRPERAAVAAEDRHGPRSHGARALDGLPAGRRRPDPALAVEQTRRVHARRQCDGHRQPLRALPVRGPAAGLVRRPAAAHPSADRRPRSRSAARRATFARPERGAARSGSSSLRSAFRAPENRRATGLRSSRSMI